MAHHSRPRCSSAPITTRATAKAFFPILSSTNGFDFPSVQMAHSMLGPLPHHYEGEGWRLRKAGRPIKSRRTRLVTARFGEVLVVWTRRLRAEPAPGAGTGGSASGCEP